MSAETYQVPSDRGQPFWKQRRWEATIAFWVLHGADADRPRHLHLPPDRLGLPDQPLRRAQHRQHQRVRRLRQLRRHPPRRRSSARRLRTIVIFTHLHRAAHLRRLARAGDAGQRRSASAAAFFRTVFFIPTAISYVIASLVWRMGIFNGLLYGVANMVLYEWFGFEEVDLLDLAAGRTTRPGTGWCWSRSGSGSRSGST